MDLLDSFEQDNLQSLSDQLLAISQLPRLHVVSLVLLLSGMREEHEEEEEPQIGILLGEGAVTQDTSSWPLLLDYHTEWSD